LFLCARSPAVAATCDAKAVIGRLSDHPQPALGWFSEFVAWFTTPFKRHGISGWIETGCLARATGAAVRDGQHSTDGFWTIDLQLTSFAIGDVTATGAHFIRIEVEPERKAHDVCAARPPRAGDRIELSGPVLIDTDGDSFLEIHPVDDFQLLPDVLHKG
jgi:hypothetical protein